MRGDNRIHRARLRAQMRIGRRFRHDNALARPIALFVERRRVRILADILRDIRRDPMPHRPPLAADPPKEAAFAEATCTVVHRTIGSRLADHREPDRAQQFPVLTTAHGHVDMPCAALLPFEHGHVVEVLQLVQPSPELIPPLRPHFDPRLIRTRRKRQHAIGTDRLAALPNHPLRSLDRRAKRLVRLRGYVVLRLALQSHALSAQAPRPQAQLMKVSLHSHAERDDLLLPVLKTLCAHDVLIAERRIVRALDCRRAVKARMIQRLYRTGFVQ
ncbi:hypothetical protein X942_6726 [Burkholderia pseudomallei MSHR5596]|nr:hypothetical protein X942_6726 [Burkholderia pseudomallei MSHR5596]